MELLDKQAATKQALEYLEREHSRKKDETTQRLQAQFACHACGKTHERVVQLVDPKNGLYEGGHFFFNICADCILQAASTIGITL